MAKTNVKKIIQAYARELSKTGISFEHLYLFGSYATNKNTRWSDIDVLVTTKKNLEKDYLNYKKNLRHALLNVDTRIEPHACTVDDFKNGETLPAIEAKRYGIKIV
ncbi:MAG: nucleotidyltransferase domain-containing protein [Candidatus Magasanikbacteria bacterium]|nr:nucleotidyltransferase domain-containing protein [Candidatus Magasanikbacteria bacterium]